MKTCWFVDYGKILFSIKLVPQLLLEDLLT